MRNFLLLIVIGVLPLNTLTAQISAERSDSIAVDSQKAATKDSSRVKTKFIPPTFQGGTHNDFKDWIGKHIKYPEDALKQKIEGRVTVSFVIEKDGMLGDIEILESPSDMFSRAVLRVMVLSPKWTPGTEDGKNVRVKVVIPVDFKLNHNHNHIKSKSARNRNEQYI